MPYFNKNRVYHFIRLQGIFTGIQNPPGGEVPQEFSLSQNYPNPFNPATTIKYSIPKSSLVKLVIYDLIGREVATLVNGNKQAGYYEVYFDATNIANCNYLYKLQKDEFTSIKKMSVIK